jgi:CelD/BcsL family acetyltransferase involved in cellulose biosynthesis
VRAVPAHEQALRTATGRCARFVLALVSTDQIPRVCASQPAWGAAQTARELRRRIAAIDADKLLRGTVQGQACRAAYLYELKNTRVTLRVATPSAAVR